MQRANINCWLGRDLGCNAWFEYKWGQFNRVKMFWWHILRIIPLTPLWTQVLFFANFKFEFYNLIRLSYLIYCCQRTKSWTSSLRKSVLILTRSDFEEVNVVTCWDKKMWFVSLNSRVLVWSKKNMNVFFVRRNVIWLLKSCPSTFIKTHNFWINQNLLKFSSRNTCMSGIWPSVSFLVTPTLI